MFWQPFYIQLMESGPLGYGLLTVPDMGCNVLFLWSGKAEMIAWIYLGPKQGKQKGDIVSDNIFKRILYFD